ncbi:hypothetical protein LIA77_05756 [Sarocladium implicatum]|nr:hypothetical protein LIA77_05756 [Sarocladium implicatum]
MRLVRKAMTCPSMSALKLHVPAAFAYQLCGCKREIQASLKAQFSRCCDTAPAAARARYVGRRQPPCGHARRETIGLTSSIKFLLLARPGFPKGNPLPWMQA